MKPVHFLGNSRTVLRKFPPEVKDRIGYALYEAQKGEKAANTKPLKGFHGASVLEVIEDNDGSTYRAVYTIRFSHAVYVLHTFQKKSKKGIATPKHDMALIKSRLKLAEEDWKKGDHIMTENITRGSGNIFADLGFDNPEEMETKAQLVSQINAIVKQRKLTQKKAGELLGISQSRVSDLARGGLSGFSVDRLLRLLNKLDQEVEIIVKRKRSRRPATTTVTFADQISVS